jgi:DNA-directed RNA polymerase subunit omega
LSTLIQKRLVQLNQGARPLIDTTIDDKMEIVLQEILNDKIFLDTSNEVQSAVAGDFLDPPELDFDDL